LLPVPWARLELIGTFRTIVINVDSRELTMDGDDGTVVADADGQDPTEVIRDELTPEELVLLAALDEPLLETGGVGRPHNTKGVATRLDRTRRQVEHHLADLRLKLTGLGVSGLMRDEMIAPGDLPGGENYVEKLGMLAYAHGWVLTEDRDLLPRD
jgi:hypothetical protein